jgi:hypothetical protein
MTCTGTVFDNVGQKALKYGQQFECHCTGCSWPAAVSSMGSVTSSMPHAMGHHVSSLDTR